MFVRFAAILVFSVISLGHVNGAIVTLSSGAGSGGNYQGNLTIQLTAVGANASFRLNQLQIWTSNIYNTSDSVDWALRDSNYNIVNGLSGSSLGSTLSGSGADRLMTWDFTSNPNTFGAGTYWLLITNLNSASGPSGAGSYDVGNSATLASTNPSILNGIEVYGYYGTPVDVGNSYHANLTVAVPEPATIILTGSALAAGVVGAFIKNRRRRMGPSNSPTTGA